MIYRNRDVAHGKERREVGVNRRQVLAHVIYAFTDTVMWPTVKSAGRREVTGGRHWRMVTMH
jgi:hypothetical protein